MRAKHTAMSQSTFEDGDLFDEAASDIRDDVETHLDAARAALPESEEIWTVEADNTLGVLNSLRSALDTGNAAEQLRDAKKWYTMGERADAFEDAEDLAADIKALETVMGDIEAAHEQVKGLTSTVPELRGTLNEAHEAAGQGGDEESDDASTDADVEEADEAEEAAE